MTQPTGSGSRRCAGCGTMLAADNSARVCGRCHREQRDQLARPPQLKHEFFETDQFRAAFESQHIGKVLRAYRNHPHHLRLFGKALNQELLGRWLGLTQAQVSKLENGKAEENLDALRNYAKVLHLPQHMLWFDLPGQTRFARMQRLSLPDLQVSSSTNLHVPSAPEFAAVGPGVTTTADSDPVALVGRLTEARAHFEQMYRNVGGAVTRARIDPFLAKQMLPVFASATDGDGVATRRAIGGLVALAGVCAYDSEDWVSADSHFAQALTIAKTSNDNDFYAYVLALTVNQALALEDYKRAESLTTAALQSSARLAPAPLSVDLQVMRAKALASMGDTSEAMAVIQKLETAVDKLPVDNEMVEASYVQGGHLHAGLAEALMSLGDLGAAQRFGEQSLNSDGHARGRVNRLASMAAIEVARGEIERASFLACEMVDKARGMESRRLIRRFMKLRESLADKPTVVSRDAIDRINRAITLIP